MTCVVAWVDSEGATMGADSAGSDGWHVRTRTDPKVFRVSFGGETALIGFTTSFRMGQIVRFHLAPSLGPRGGRDPYTYMVCDVIPAAREALSEHGFMAKHREREDAGCWMVAFAGRLFVVESDMQVGTYAEPYSAIGCGTPFALGALRNTRTRPKTRVRRALETAAYFSAGVRPPFRIRTVRW